MHKSQQQLDYVMQQAKTRSEELKGQTEAKVDEVKQEAERIARETAQATTEAISKVALAAFAAIVTGVMAAGIGGYIVRLMSCLRLASAPRCKWIPIAFICSDSLNK